VLVDVSKLDTSTTLLGRPMPLPILLAPASSHRLAHPEGELATARGAGTAGVTMVLSSSSNTPVEDVVRAASRPIWFQLYVPKDRGFAKELVQRVDASGAQALCVTVDNPVTGARNTEQRAKLVYPPGVTFPHYVGMGEPSSSVTLDEVRPAQLTWKDIEWLRSLTRLPVLVKGVLHPRDAALAVESGVAGIVVSNHGGRDLDTLPATIDALPRVAERVAGRVPLLVDGGIRRGTDVVKALARGANAVLIGRPYLYGLAAGGADGVTHVLKILRQELLLAMALTGRPTIGSIDRSVLWE
jgi:4-hydroxymandelate oxidase